MSDSPKHDVYDVVVVGGGLGGLSAGAVLSRLGKSVLVVERQDGPGGYAHAFRRGQYLFDPAIHWTAQGNEGGFLDVYLRALGVRDVVDLMPIDEFYAAYFPGEHLHVSVGVEAFVESYAKRWPAEHEAIAEFMATAGRLVEESHTVPPQLSFAELGKAEEQFPTLFKYRLLTLGEALDAFVKDQQLKGALSAVWPYLGIPPGRVSFVLYTSMIFAMIESPTYCRGSFQTLADGFVTALERSGGELLLSTTVTGIEVSDGRVTGVTLEGDRHVRADAVIANADATQTVEQLVGAEHFPSKFMQRFRRYTPSLSGFVLYTATDLDLHDYDIASETFVFMDWDHDRDHAASISANSVSGTWASIPTLHDPSLAPEGEHLLVFSGLVPNDIGEPWESAKSRFTELMLDRIEMIVPDFRNHITFLEAATPDTMKRFTLTREGALYGWEQTPQQSTGRRLQHRSPIDGLLFAGHWTEPGAGSFRSMYSGILAATLLCGLDSIGELLGALGGAGRPG